MKKIILLLFILAITVASAQEGSLKDNSNTESLIGVPQEINDLTNNFFNLLIKKDVEEAYSNLLVKSPLFEKKESVKNLITQTKKSFNIYGDLMNYEAINFEYVTESYLRIRLLGLHSNYPTRWVITFYRSPAKGWFVTNVKFDDLSEFFFTDE